MIEVFKTNVGDRDSADMLVTAIHKVFPLYAANFDLDDCDRILRVECNSGFITRSSVIELVESYGFTAEVLREGEFYDSFAILRRWI